MRRDCRRHDDPADPGASERGTRTMGDERSDNSRYRWYLIVGLCLCTAASLWYGFSIGLLLPDMSRDLGLSHSQEGALAGAFFVGQLIFMVPVSNLLSKWHPIRTMTAALLLTTMLLFAATTLPGYYTQVAVRFLVAVLFLTVNPVRTMLIDSMFPPREVPQANSVFAAAFGVVQGIAFWTAGPVLDVVESWRAMLGIFTVMSAVGTVAWYLLGRRYRPVAPRVVATADGDSGRSPLRVMLRAEVWYLALLGFGAAAMWLTYLTFWPTFAKDSLHLSDAQIGVAMGTAALAMVPGALGAAWLARRVRRRPLLVVATLLQIPAYALTLATGNLPLLLVISVAQGLLWFYFPLMLSVPFQIAGLGQREIVMATAVFFMANSVALAGGPALAGALADVFPLGAVLLGSCAFTLLSTVGAVLLGNGDEPAPAAARSAAA